MNNIINKSLIKAKSYTEYRKMILDLIKKGKSTGLEQNEDLFNYSRLNDKRMKRLDKQTKLSENAQLKIERVQKDFTWLVLTEGWCGDAAQTLPVINKFAELNSKIELKVVLRDENEDLMNKFLTNGSKSIPKLVVLEKNTNKVVGSWGPRSRIAAKLVTDYKEKNGRIDDEFKKKLQNWYNKDKGINIENEMVELIDRMNHL